MDKSMIYQIGIILLSLDLGWLIFYYFYATAEVYNLVEGSKYRYLGQVWIKRKKGEHYLYLHREIIEEAVTTEYKIVTGWIFYYSNKNEKIRISFQGSYDVMTSVTDPISVKNHIATCIGL